MLKGFRVKLGMLMVCPRVKDNDFGNESGLFLDCTAVPEDISMSRKAC